MRLKSLHTKTTTNQRLITTYVGNNMSMLPLVLLLCCLLSSEVWSYANIKQHRLVRQLSAANALNYDKDSSMTNLYHQPHFTGNRSVIVQLFEWKFLDIAEECRNFLGPQGYAGVQISPVLEHTVIKDSTLNHPWWERYEVISYRLASRSGDESDFWSMSRICNEHGVRIYVDVVLNHMAAPLNFLFDTDEQDNKDFIVNTLLETNVNISQLNYPNVSYTQVDFHRSLCNILSYTQDAHEIRNCQLNGHPDLDHSRASVQKHIVEMLNKFIDMGVAGFRIDTAKYMWPIDLKNIFKQVKNLSTEFNFKKNSRPFVYNDVFDMGLDTVSKTEYATYGVVSEYLYPAELSTIIQRKVPLSSLINWGPALGFLAHKDALVFIDSHDTQRGLPKQLGHNEMLTHKQRLKYIMANVFMLIHPYGAIKRIMSSYYFSDKDIDKGPPVEDDEGEQISSPQFDEQQQCVPDSGWVCEHRWPVLVNMLKVANYFGVPGQEEQSIIYFQTNGANQVAFCRGYKAFVAINNEAEIEFEKEVYACLEPGTYCDMVTGGRKEGEEKCHGKMVVINEQGYTKLNLAVADLDSQDYEEEGNEVEVENEEETGRVESYGILVIYVESKIQPKEGNKANAKEEDVNKLEEERNGEQLPSEAEAKEDGEDELPNEGEENDAAAEQPDEADAETLKEGDEADENPEEENEEDDGEKEADEAGENTESEGDDPKSANEKGEADPEENKEEDVKDEAAEESGADESEDGDAEGGNDVEPEEEDVKDEAAEEAGPAESEDGDAGGDNEAELEEEDVQADAADAEEAGAAENVEGEDEDGNETPNEDLVQEPEDANAEEEAGEKASDENAEENGDDETNPKSKEAEEAADQAEEEDNNEIEEKEDADKDEAEEEIASNDQPPEEEEKVDETKDLTAENSLEIITDETENAVEEPETAESRNLDDKTPEAEKQIEKPIAEIVEQNSDAPDAVTTKVPQVQAAGVYVKPKGDGNNG